MKTSYKYFFINDELVKVKAISVEEIEEAHEKIFFCDQNASVEGTEILLTCTKAIQEFDSEVASVQLISPGHPSIYEGYTKSGEFIRRYVLHETN